MTSNHAMSNSFHKLDWLFHLSSNGIANETENPSAGFANTFVECFSTALILLCGITVQSLLQLSELQ